MPLEDAAKEKMQTTTSDKGSQGKDVEFAIPSTPQRFRKPSTLDVNSSFSAGNLHLQQRQQYTHSAPVTPAHGNYMYGSSVPSTTVGKHISSPSRYNMPYVNVSPGKLRLREIVESIFIAHFFTNSMCSMCF